jgi:hypothetical protein
MSVAVTIIIGTQRAGVTSVVVVVVVVVVVAGKCNVL